jgi:mannose-1-phosphate guanylyltransferase
VRAFLLAGGRGERLRPLTLTIPKCLAPIAGTPLLAIWIDLLERERITDILVNVSHHVEQVRSFLERTRLSVRVSLVVEAEPVGSAGTVARHRDFVAGENDFWILYADNLSAVSLRAMAETHRRHDGVLTMGLFHATEPRAAGIAELDGTGRIIGFKEKPERPQGDLANAGVYLARQSLFDHIPVTPGALDFGHDVLPTLAGRMYGHELTGYHMDIGTPEALRQATETWCGLRTAGRHT